MLTSLLLQVAVAMPLLERGEFAEALPLLQKACERKEANGCYLYGRTLFSLDRYEPARAALLQIRRVDPYPWRVDDALAQIHEALGEPKAAAAAFSLALQGNRDTTAEPRLHYGQFLIRQGRPAEALAPLAAAASQFPRHQEVRFETGRALYQLGRLAEAVSHLEAAPSVNAARLLLAKVRRQSNTGRP